MASFRGSRLLPVVSLLLAGPVWAGEATEPSLPAAALAAEPEPSPAPPSEHPAVRWEDGRTVIEGSQGRLEISNRLHFRFTSVNPDDQVRLSGTSGPGVSKSSFSLARAKTSFEGWFWKKELTFDIQLAWAGKETGASTTSPLEDFKVTWDASRKGAFRVSVGQFKVPFGRQEQTSSKRQEFADRSILSGEFTHGRDIGLGIDGKLAGGKVEYGAGIFNGNLQSRLENDNTKFQYDAQLLVQPWGDARYSEGDLESKKHPLVGFFVEFENNDMRGATSAIGGLVPTEYNNTTLGAGLVFKYQGFAGFGEYFDRKREPTAGATFHSDGYHLQVGYFLKRDVLELAFRYAAWDPTDVVSGDDRSEIGGVVGYFIRKHDLKLQADFREIKDDARDVANQELRIQAVIVF
jgi:hypothetical protein